MILNHEDILEILPHRYPMLLVDRIVELEPMKRAVRLKAVPMLATNCALAVNTCLPLYND